jgi:hypothetical protein
MLRSGDENAQEWNSQCAGGCSHECSGVETRMLRSGDEKFGNGRLKAGCKQRIGQGWGGANEGQREPVTTDVLQRGRQLQSTGLWLATTTRFSNNQTKLGGDGELWTMAKTRWARANNTVRRDRCVQREQKVSTIPLTINRMKGRRR